MKRVLKLSLLGLLLLVGLWFAANPGSLPAQAATSESGRTAICLPGIYLQDPGDCAPLGPSAYLTQMAQEGVTFPITALPAQKPPFDLTYVNTRYGQVHNLNAPVYGSVEDAMTGNKGKAIQRIDSSFAYISYSEDTVVDGRRFYMIDPGMWMTANDAWSARRTTPTSPRRAWS